MTSRNEPHDRFTQRGLRQPGGRPSSRLLGLAAVLLLGCGRTPTASNPDLGPAAQPTIAPGTSASATPITATVTCSTAGSLPYLTTDGSAPTASSIQSVTATFTASGTLQAICAGGGYTASTVASATYTIAAAGEHLTHGFVIPSGHPRLWWTPARIAAAKSWLAAHPFTTGSNRVDDAMKHVVAGADCSAQVAWAAGWAPSPGQVTPAANGSDDMRGEGEAVLLVYDWCHDQFSPAQRTAFIANWNTWVGNVQRQDWGGPSMSGNNYFWGNLRNELEWGIVSYGENGAGPGSKADDFIHSALATRWAAFLDTAKPGGLHAGGVPLEGETYGAAQLGYLIVPVTSLANMGRDLLSETSFFKAFAYWLLYWTTPSSTVVKDSGGISTFHLATVNEEDKMLECGGILFCRAYYTDWMAHFAQHAAVHYPAAPMAGHARQWLAQLGPVPPLQRDPYATGDHGYYVSNYISSSDPGGTARSYASLPLDYWATGPQYGVAKTAWDTTSTVASIFMGTPLSLVGHAHDDWGSFSLWRGGRWVMRETTGYTNQIAGTPGIAGGAAQETASQLAHNTLVFTNVALGLDSNPRYTLPTVHRGPAVTRRLDSQPGWFYVATDLTNLYRWDEGHSHFDTGVVGHVERELLYLRALETMVVLDRVTTANQTHGGSLTAAQVVTSFVTHFETSPVIEDPNHFTATNGPQALRQTVLVPAAASSRVIDEGGRVGQHRVEVDSSGAAQRYHLHVLQARAAAGSNLAAAVVDSDPSSTTAGTFTVTLQPAAGAATTVVFQKGPASSGGTVSLAGAAAAALRADVRPIRYTDDGPVW